MHSCKANTRFYTPRYDLRRLGGGVCAHIRAKQHTVILCGRDHRLAQNASMHRALANTACVPMRVRADCWRGRFELAATREAHDSCANEPSVSVLAEGRAARFYGYPYEYSEGRAGFYGEQVYCSRQAKRHHLSVDMGHLQCGQHFWTSARTCGWAAYRCG